MSIPSDACACWICFDSQSPNIMKIELNDSCEWPQLFEYCIGEQMHCIEAPIFFCGMCTQKLKIFAQFKKTCIQSNALWKYSGPKTVSIGESAEFKLAEVKSESECCDDVVSENKFDISTAKDDEIVDVGDEFTTEQDTIYFEVPVVKHEEKKTKAGEEEAKTKTISCDKNIFLCKKCGRPYRSEKWLKRHRVVCKGKRPWKSKLIEVKPKSIYFYCGICEFYAKDSEEVNKHFKDHFIETKFNCILCNYTGKDLAHMVFHRYDHYPQDYKHKFICPDCNKDCRTRRAVEFHYRSKHLGTAGGWCYECDKIYRNYKKYKIHINTHGDHNVYICDHCNRSFSCKSVITEHLKTHSAILKYICDCCGRGFKRVSLLQSHIYYHHTDNTISKVLCSHCNKYFKAGRAITRHLRSIQREKLFVCEICSKSYRSLSELKSHAISHSDERRFSCDKCNKTYKRAIDLKQHLENHGGEKRFICVLCKKALRSKRSLNRHQAVHTGVKPQKCLLCEKTFYDKRLLKSHCINKHKIDYGSSSTVALNVNKFEVAI